MFQLLTRLAPDLLWRLSWDGNDEPIWFVCDSEVQFDCHAGTIGDAVEKVIIDIWATYDKDFAAIHAQLKHAIAELKQSHEQA